MTAAHQRLATYIAEHCPTALASTNTYGDLDNVLDLVAEALEEHDRQAPHVDLAAHVRPEVYVFALAMEEKLRANEHKGGWKTDAADALFNRVWEETGELGREVRAGRWAPSVERSRRILHEAADVANMAMMVADVCGGLALVEAPKQAPPVDLPALRVAVERVDNEEQRRRTWPALWHLHKVARALVDAPPPDAAGSVPQEPAEPVRCRCVNPDIFDYSTGCPVHDPRVAKATSDEEGGRHG